MTKEELLKQNAKLQEKIESLETSSKDKRKEFARAFHWYKQKNNPYYHEESLELETPTWEAVFVEIGKLLEKTTRATGTQRTEKAVYSIPKNRQSECSTSPPIKNGMK